MQELLKLVVCLVVVISGGVCSKTKPGWHHPFRHFAAVIQLDRNALWCIWCVHEDSDAELQDGRSLIMLHD